MYEGQANAGAKGSAHHGASRSSWFRWGVIGLVVVIILLSFVFLLAVGCSGGGSDRIAFVSDRDGDPEIFIMNVDGSDQTPNNRQRLH